MESDDRSKSLVRVVSARPRLQPLEEGLDLPGGDPVSFALVKRQRLAGDLLGIGGLGLLEFAT
jgi:hypothetical protein